MYENNDVEKIDIILAYGSSTDGNPYVKKQGMYWPHPSYHEGSTYFSQNVQILMQTIQAAAAGQSQHTLSVCG